MAIYDVVLCVALWVQPRFHHTRQYPASLRNKVQDLSVNTMSTADAKSIVIVGGGIIGCSTAYYLSRHPSFVSSKSTITVLEASSLGPAQGASGKAGGLVAKWAYPKELVDVSFSEHVKLAQEHNGKDRWGWRFVGCGSWEGRGEVLTGESGTGVGSGGKRKSLEKTMGLDAAQTSRRSKLPADLLWVKEDLTEAYSPMAADGATAQVHPYLFTTSMLDLAKEKGATLVQGQATSIVQSGGQVTGVSYLQPGTQTAQTLPATHVVLCAGAWSPSLVPTLPISATRAHSITVRPPASTTISPYVLFTEITLPSGKTVTPEIYARPDDEVYICGPGDDSLLPTNVDDVAVDLEACQSIQMQAASISEELRNGTVEKRQACYLPLVSSGGGPIVGAANKIAKGLFIATGHTCWVSDNPLNSTLSEISCPFVCIAGDL